MKKFVALLGFVLFSISTAQTCEDGFRLLRFAEILAETKDVGYPTDLEKTLLLKPDIILAVGSTVAGESIDAAQAGDIAPVVMADPAVYDDWQLGMSFWADVLGAPELYERMLTNYDARIGEIRAALGNVSETEISIVPLATGSTYMWMPDTAPGNVPSDVGLARPEPQTLTGEVAQERYGTVQYIQVSQERYDLLDADAIFYFTYAASDPATAEEEARFVEGLEQNPLWQSLGAVQNDRTFFVGGYWWRAQTYLLANKVIDDLFIHLTGTAAETPVLELP